MRVKQVAKICNVAPRTVAKWVDSGKMVGYKDKYGLRHISKAEVRRFLKAHGVKSDL